PSQFDNALWRVGFRSRHAAAGFSPPGTKQRRRRCCAMRFKVVLNRDGGTLRTFDLDAFVERLHTVLLRAGHEVEVAVITGNELEDALDAALESDCDVVMVGGGDGTVSAAAGRMMAQDKALAVLPAGTMNLFARSLAIPLDLDEAV